MSYPKPSEATVSGELMLVSWSRVVLVYSILLATNNYCAVYHWTEGLKLVNTFEETFGDLYGSGKGAWSQLSKTVCQNLSRVVVSLASFSGSFTVICYLLFHV